MLNDVHNNTARYSVCLLYWYKSANTDTCGAACQAEAPRQVLPGKPTRDCLTLLALLALLALLLAQNDEC
jgi:hypothetical protein